MDSVRKIFLDENKKGVSYREMGKIAQVNFSYLHKFVNGKEKAGAKIIEASKVIKFLSSS